MDIPLPEIQVDDFERSWLRFELVAKAKEWDQAKQLAILPTLLHGKLLDHYVCLSDDEKRDAGTLKTALMKHAGHPLADTLLASRMFGERTQGPKETVSDYVSDLKKLFKLAHPTEAEDSVVLLHKFITGLQRGISQQLLMKGLPASLADALKTALEVEYAFTFGAQQLQIQVIRQGSDEETKKDHLDKAIENLTKKMTDLETKLAALSNQPSAQPAQQPRRGPYRCYRNLGI